MKRHILYIGFVVVLFLILSRFLWILPVSISSGDWQYVYPDKATDFSNIFSIWQINENLGRNIALQLPINTIYELGRQIFVNFLGIPWEITEKFLWFVPFILLSVVSSYYFLLRYIKTPYIRIIGVVIFITNTYILMVLNGGQMAIALAYAFVPLIFVSWVNALFPISQDKNRFVLYTGVSLAVSLLIDYRITYISIIMLFTYTLYYLFYSKTNLLVYLKLLKNIVIILGIILIVNLFWLYPLVSQWNQTLTNLDTIYTTRGAIIYFSFTKFENAFSLLHPNWPEDIFGKTYFMNPLFLFISLIAFFPLFIFSNVKTKERRFSILYFSLVALIGAFFAKGANEPFGVVYIWLFEHFPGFIMFRDSSKWYVLVALAYSVLIPISLEYITRWMFVFYKGIKQKYVFFVRNIIYVLFVIYWLVLIRELWMGKLNGTFTPHEVPQEYIKLKEYIKNQDTFFRTFWVPYRQRFGYTSNIHPAIGSVNLLKISSGSDVVSWLREEKAQKQLQRWGVKYIIVPYDSEREIFLKERKYDPYKKEKIIAALDTISWLTKVNKFHKNAVYEIKNMKNLFFIEHDQNVQEKDDILPYVKWEMTSLSNYRINCASCSGSLLVYATAYDPNWELISDEVIVKSQRTYDGLNSFRIPQKSKNNFIIQYRAQEYVNKGFMISGVIFSCVILFGIVVFIKRSI